MRDPEYPRCSTSDVHVRVVMRKVQKQQPSGETFPTQVKIWVCQVCSLQPPDSMVDHKAYTSPLGMRQHLEEHRACLELVPESLMMRLEEEASVIVPDVEPFPPDSFIEALYDLGDGREVPADHLITSIRIKEGVGHDFVSIWNRGALSGQLTLKSGDGDILAERLGLKQRYRALHQEKK